MYNVSTHIYIYNDDDKGSCKVILAPPQLPSKPNKKLERKTNILKHLSKRNYRSSSS